MKKAFTMIELTIAIALLGTIILAVFAIFMTATKNYGLQSQKSFMQKELNFTVDAMANEMKLAHNVLPTSQGKILSSENLILTIPAIDENENFVYDGNILEYDTFIYAKEGNALRKILIPSANSFRSAKDFTVLTDVTAVNFTYAPDSMNPLSITANVLVSRAVGKNIINIQSERTAFLRNK